MRDARAADGGHVTEHEAPTLDAAGLAAARPERPGSLEPGAVVNGRYRVVRLLGRGGMGAVYQVDDQLYPGRPTALKLFLQRPTHPVDLFRAEFRTMASLRHPNVARVYDFETLAGREDFFFTMELLAGTTVSAAFRGDPRRPQGLPWQEVVELLVPVIRALAYLHKRGVVHFDLKPSNIMVGSTRERQVKVLDFGLAGLRQGDGWVGTPLYLSPEIAQSGRGDHRADLYSLGVMAFQLLSGEEPFDTTGSFERLLKQKLSEPVRFSGAAAGGVPAWLRAIVERLCAIDPADRHPTASDLLDDINGAGGLRFELETQDTSESYLFSSRFVGRRRELREIRRCIEDSLEGRGVGALLVSGRSGMGKSRLLREVRHGVQLEGIAFAEADCFEGDLSEAGPMAGLILQAASLARSAGADELLALHGPELVKLVPALARGWDLQPTPPLENAAAERRRMLEAAARFFVGLGRRLPCVLYVNDLHWARDGTIDLLAEIVHERSLADSERSAIAVLGSYRSDEVAGRPLRRLLDPRSPAATRIPALELLPLEEAEVEELLRSMLGLAALPAGLGAAVAGASGGLPFFVEEILRDLLEQGRLRLAHGEWTVERSDGGELRIDAAASFLRRSSRVTPAERALLDLLAVCARPAEVEVLASVAGASGAETREALRALSDRQMAVAIAGEREHYNLAHDRMREALYQGLPAASRTQLHLRLARCFAAELTGDERGERLFETVGHFEQAEGLLKGDAERREVARLHLRAALATNATGAFEAGVRYLERARALSGERPYESDPALAMAIEHALAASLVPLGRIDEALLAADRIVANARSVLDEAPGWETRILAHTARNEYPKAIAAGIEICGRLGLSLPRRPTRLGIAWALLRVGWRLRGRTDQELASLPRMDDARAMRLTRILTSMTGCAYVHEPNLWPIIIARCLTLMLSYGRGPTHALLFAWFGTALAAVGAFGRARRFARLSVRLMDAPDGAAFLPKLHHAMGQFLSHWSEPMTRTVEWCRSGFRQGERVEDAEFAGYCHMGWAKASLEAGEPLARVQETCQAALETIRASGQKGTELMHLPSLQAVEGLLGLTPHPSRLAGPHYDEQARVRAGLSNAQDGFRLLEKARLACLFRERAGLALGDELVRATEVGLPATFYLSIGRYLACLVWLRECHAGGSRSTRLRALARVALGRRRLRRWALRCPESFDHRYLLVEAERLRALGKAERAAAAYHHAIAAARRGGFVHDAALADELAAEHHLSQGDSLPAQAHLRAALAGYRQWGATAKVDDLLARYPGL